MAAGAEERFQFLFESPSDRPIFDRWLDRVSSKDDPLYFGVVDRNSAACEGRQALMGIDPEHGVIEIGSILWGPAIARSRVATEALYLFSKYVFDDLQYRRFEWKCNALNQPSIRAAKRFGFTFEGVFRQHMVTKGLNRDTAWFSITDKEWPQIRKKFEAWLEPSNFDEHGKQKIRLNDFMGSQR